MASDLASLIEPAFVFAAPMQRDGHNVVCLFENRRSSRSHQRCKWSRKRPTPLIFQSVNDLSQRAIVLPDCPRSIDGALGLAALPAQRLGVPDQGLGVGR